MHHDLPLDQIQEQVLYGGLLGDSYLSKLRIKRKNSTLQINHSLKQAEYTQWKYSIFQTHTHAQPRIIRNGGWGGPLIRFSTLAYPCFTRARDLCYRNGRKTLTKRWLAKIKPLGLAVWYMDDGSLTTSNWNMRIATNSFTKAEHQLLQNWLIGKWGVRTVLRQDHRGTGYFLDFHAEQRDKFFVLIRPHIHPSMKYKVDVPPLVYETCLVCRRSFRPKRNIRRICVALAHRMYCSVECRKYAASRRRYNPQIRSCRICAAKFTPHTGNQVTCNRDCSLKYHHLRKNENKFMERFRRSLSITSRLSRTTITSLMDYL